MTEKELDRLNYLNIEIKKLKNEIYEMENSSIVKGQIISGIPKRGGVNNPTEKLGVMLTERKQLLAEAMLRAETERNKIERYIADIEEPEIRVIMRLRHIEGMNWERIGDEINMERTTVSKKYKRYLSAENSGKRAI